MATKGSIFKSFCFVFYLTLLFLFNQNSFVTGSNTYITFQSLDNDISSSPNIKYEKSSENYVSYLLHNSISELFVPLKDSFVQWNNKIYLVHIEENNDKPNLGSLKLIPYNPEDQINNMLDYFHFSNNHLVNIDKFVKDFSHSFDLTSKLQQSIDSKLDFVSYFPGIKHKMPKKRSEMLLVFTTCNQLEVTILSLQHLKNIESLIDILIVDDHSTDGTVEYLRKKGYAVISKPKATGLTESWNLGYRLALAYGYENALFTNNDVLISSGTLEILNLGLKNYPVIVPMTSTKGAGHNPIQSLAISHNINAIYEPYIHDYRNVNQIQNNLLSRYVFGSDISGKCPAVISKTGTRPKFNGFSFSVNLNKIHNATYLPDVYLFDPHNVIVGQEENLATNMHKNNLYPLLLQCVYSFHFKSVTVSPVNITVITEKLAQYGVSASPVKGSAVMVHIIYNDPKTGEELVNKLVDVREDLRWYHPEEDKDFLNSFLKEYSSKIKGPEDSNKAPSHFVNPNDIRSSKYNISELNLFSISSSQDENKLSLLYKNYNKYSFNIYKQPVCVYPDIWSKYCDKLVLASTNPQAPSNFTIQLYPLDAFVYASTQSDEVVVGFIVNTPITDSQINHLNSIMEFGNSLTSMYKNIKVKYIYQTKDWYSAAKLHDVDILIVTTFKFNLPKLMLLNKNHQSHFIEDEYPICPNENTPNADNILILKSNLVTIAWIHDMHQVWTTLDWLGNYDYIFTSSLTSANFFNIMNEYFDGFTEQCVHNCPNYVEGRPITPLTTSDKIEDTTHAYFSNHAKHLHTGFNYTSQINFSSRIKVPIKVLPFATSENDKSFLTNLQKLEHNDKSYNESKHSVESILQNVDYLFLSDNYNSQKDMFIPSDIQKYKGYVIPKDNTVHDIPSQWKSYLSPNLTYQHIQYAYKFVKVIVDDSSILEYSWGGLNQVVFDGYSNGVLVISNNKIGFEEVFGTALQEANLNLPVYSTRDQLNQLLNYYLSNPKILTDTVKLIQKEILKSHTYQQRSKDFSDMLKKSFNIDLKTKDSDEGTARPNYNLISSNSKSICIGIRTCKSQQKEVEVLLRIYLNQLFSNQETLNNLDLTLELYLVDTENNREFTHDLFKLANKINSEYFGNFVKVFVSNILEDKTSNSNGLSTLYGYPLTDNLRHFLVEKDTCNYQSSIFNNIQTKSLPTCEWIMFTNGDNAYSSSWLKSILRYMNPDYDIIAWDFITHHMRNNLSNQKISTNFTRKFIDLGSVIVRKSLFDQSKVQFLDKSVFTVDLFARDYFTIETLKAQTEFKRTIIIPEVLFFHQ